MNIEDFEILGTQIIDTVNFARLISKLTLLILPDLYPGLY